MRHFYIGVLAIAVKAGTAFGQAAVGTSVNVSTLNTGTVLSVSSSVSADRRYVGVNIDVSASVLEGLDLFSVSNGGISAGANVGAGAGNTVGGLLAPAKMTASLAILNRDKALLAKAIKIKVLSGVSLKAAVKAVADASGENVVLGIRGLQDAGVNVDAPHDFALHDGTVGEALFEIVHTALSDTNMVLKTDESVITLMTLKQADNTVVTRTYYVEDLMANLPKIAAGGVDLDALAKKKGGPLTIADIITASVRPDIWKVNGGKIGEIGMFNNRVRITAPETVQAVLDGPKVFNPNAGPLYVNYAQ